MRLPLLKRLPHSWHLYRCLLFCLPSFFICLEWQKGHFLCSKVLTPFKALQDKACGEFWHLFCYFCQIAQIAQSIGQGRDFGRYPAFGSADCLFERPPFAP